MLDYGGLCWTMLDYVGLWWTMVDYGGHCQRALCPVPQGLLFMYNTHYPPLIYPYFSSPHPSFKVEPYVRCIS